jgi:nucleoside-diphosphate-sugar epimerase
VVTESSKIYEISPDSSLRVARLVLAERACWDAGGCCLRLAGLYDLQRGAHNYWLTSNSSSGKVVAGSPDGLINLLHYEDAAAACLAALRAGPGVCQSKTFLISDGHPLSRHAICHSAFKAKVYQQQGFVMPSFAGDDDGQPGSLGKIYDGTVSNQLLNWRPRYESFDAFMEANA